MKKYISLMLSFLMLINPIAGVLAEEVTQTPVITETQGTSEGETPTSENQGTSEGETPTSENQGTSEGETLMSENQGTSEGVTPTSENQGTSEGETLTSENEGTSEDNKDPALTPVTEPVSVTAPQDGNTEVSEKVDAIDVTGEGDLVAAAVIGSESASAELIVGDEIKVTSPDGNVTGGYVAISGEESNAALTAGNVLAETEGNGVNATGLLLDVEPSSVEGTANANVADVTAIAANGDAIAVDVESDSDQSIASVSAENVTAKTEGDSTAVAIGVDVFSNGDQSIKIIETGDISATATEGYADGIQAAEAGDKGQMLVNSGKVTSEGKLGAEGVLASSKNGTDSTGGNSVTVVTTDIVSNSSEGYAEGANIESTGDHNATAVTVGDISVEGKKDSTGILANTNESDAYGDEESSSSGNKAIVNAGNVEVTSTQEYSYGINAQSSGTQNETTVKALEIVSTSNEQEATGVSATTNGENNSTSVIAGNVTTEGQTGAIGVQASATNNVESNGGNNTTVTTNNISVASSEGYAAGVEANVAGNKNTLDLTTGDITVEGSEGATAVFLITESVYSESDGETVGSDNKVVANVGDIKGVVTNQADEGNTYAYGNVTGIEGVASNEGNTLEISAGKITAEALVDVVNSHANAEGVSTISLEGGKQTVTTGDIEVKAISKSEFDEQAQKERAFASVKGVDAEANGEGSEVTITTGSVTAEAAADGVLLINPDYTSTRTTASGTAVELSASDSGNISYTAEGDVVLTLTRNMEERTGDEQSTSSYTYEDEAVTYTGVTKAAAITISVVGSDSEVAAVIKGNVKADSTTNRPDADEPVIGDASGVVIGDKSLGSSLYDSKRYDENGNLVSESKADGSFANYSDGKKTYEYNGQTGISTQYREDGTKQLERDSSGNTVYYDENGNETSRTGELKENTPQTSGGTANVKIEGDITSNGVGLEVVPVLSDSQVNVIVEGTIKGEGTAVVVNDNVNAGNFNLTVWKIEPTVSDEYDENGEIVGEKESYLEVAAPDGNMFTNDEAAAEELVKQVQYIIKVDPNISNAHVDLDGTTKFTDFTGEEYDVAHEDDKVVVKISADSGYRITGAFNGEGKQETLLKDSDGNYYIVVPRGGGVYLTATVEEIREESQEETEERTEPTRVKTDEQEKEDGAPAARETVEGNTLNNNAAPLADQETVESNIPNNNAAVLAALEKVGADTPNNRVAIPAVNSLLKGQERKTLATLAPTQQLLVILEKAGFSDAAASSGLTAGEETKKLLDSLDVDLRKAVKTVYRYENGVKVKWYYVEMNLPGNKIARYGFRQLEDGTWVMKLL